MEELTTETLETESADDDMDVLPEAMAPDAEAALPESEEDLDEGDYEPESDENDVEDSEFFEDLESDAGESVDADSSLGEETENSEPAPEKTENSVSGPETVSGNSAGYPYGSGADASTHAAYESGDTYSLLLVETLERQNDVLYSGFVSILFILGIILGVLIIHGFRLRRV